MIKSISFFLIILFAFTVEIVNAQTPVSIKLTVSVSPEVKNLFMKGGRIMLHLTNQNNWEVKPKSEATVGITPENWESNKSFVLDSRKKNVLTIGLDKLVSHISEKYYFSVTYKQNTDDGNERVEGNLYSETDSVSLSPTLQLHLTLKSIYPPIKIVDSKFVKVVEIKSKWLSDFFGRPRTLKASILLPATYFEHPEKSFPICYRAPGLNGRYDQVNGMWTNKDFNNWWFAKDAPQVIYVFLDSQGPFGDTYQVDSDNNGPCGKALTEELIPAIETQVHYQPASKKRYVAGKSTGGWIAVGLQVFYPDFFDGCWSYSPDPLDFEHYGLIDIYHDSTIFYNKFGYLQPGRRTIYGEPTFSMKDWIANENVNSRTNDYRISGGQFGAYNAVFGPRAADGFPSLMFDPYTGVIDHAIAKQWEKYDIKKVLENNWATLGPKLQGKLWIWTGDMDGLYSNVATRFLQKFLEKTTNPKSDAKISFTAMAGHTQEWSDKAVITMVAEKAASSQK
jgi:S-formylglutathione hydrolase FrmB